MMISKNKAAMQLLALCVLMGGGWIYIQSSDAARSSQHPSTLSETIDVSAGANDVAGERQSGVSGTHAVLDHRFLAVWTALPSLMMGQQADENSNENGNTEPAEDEASEGSEEDVEDTADQPSEEDTPQTEQETEDEDQPPPDIQELMQKSYSELTPEERRKRTEYIREMLQRQRGKQKIEPEEPERGFPRPIPGLRKIDPTPIPEQEELPPPIEEPDGFPDELMEAVPGAVPDDNFQLPAEERLYSFGLKNASYIELVETFARKAGTLPLFGVPVDIQDAPQGTINFVSSELLDFRSALHQVNELLFHEIRPALYLMYQEDSENPKNNRLMLHAVKETRFKLPRDRFFTSLDAVDQSGLMPSDIVWVFFHPEDVGSLKVFNEYVSTMLGDDTLVSTEDSGYINYLGRVDKLNQLREFMSMLEGFAGGQDFQRLPVKHVEPSEIMDVLSMLVDGVESAGGDASRPRRAVVRRGAKPEELELESERVYVIPDDAHDSLLVRGLPHKVNEIEAALKYVDIPDMPFESEMTPEEVKLKYARADEAAELLNQIVNGTGAGPARRSPRGRKSPAPGAEATGITGSEEISLGIIPNLRSNSLVLQGPQELIAQAKLIIADIVDVPAPPGTNYRIITIENSDPQEIAETVQGTLGGAAKGPRTAGQLTAHAGEGVVIVVGDPSQMDEAEQLIKELDRADRERSEVHSAKLESATPSIVVQILQMMENSGAVTKRSRRRAPANQPGNRFYPDDANGMIYFHGTRSEWESDFLPVVMKIDKNTQVSEIGGNFIRLEFQDPQTVVGTLTTLYQARRPKAGETGPRFAPAPPDGVIVAGEVTPKELQSIRETIAMMDVDPEADVDIERRMFELQHIDPAEVQRTIQALYVVGAPRGRRGQPAGQPVETVHAVATARGVYVMAESETMIEIAELIADMDQSGEDVPESIFQPFALQHASAEDVAVKLQAILQIRWQEWIQQQQKPGAPKQPNALPQPSVLPDEATQRVFVTAPKALITYAEEVIRELDTSPGDPQSLHLEIYHCVNASAEELASVLSSMFSGELNAAAVTTPTAGGDAKNRLRNDRIRRMLQSRAGGGAESDIQITPLPGNRSIAIAAPTVEEVQAIMARARMLDEVSSSSDKVSKRFVLQHADVDEVSDAIIEMLDPAGLARAATSEEEGYFSYDTNRRRVGKEIAVWPMYESSTLLVYAAPEKMKAVEMLIAEREAVAEEGQQDGSITDNFQTYTLQHLDVFDALDLVDRYLSFYFPNTSSPPVDVEYFDEKTVVITGTHKYFSMVEELLRNQVDIPENVKTQEEIMVIRKLPSGVEPDRFLQMLQKRVPNLELEVERLSPDQKLDNDAVPEVEPAETE